MQSVSDDLHAIVNDICREQGVELVEIVRKGKHVSSVLQVFVDKEGGITLDNCVAISQRLSDILDEAFPDMESYRLEVSSPGIDRPLTTEKDFKRNIGRRVAIECQQNEPLKRIKGDIVDANAEVVQIDTGKKVVDVAYTSMKLAKIQIKF